RITLRDDGIRHQDVLDGLLGKGKQKRAIPARRQARNSLTEWNLRQESRINRQEFAAELHVTRVAHLQDKFGPTIRDERIRHIRLLCRGDNPFTVLAHLTSKACGHTLYLLSLLLPRKDIVRFIKDENVPQDFT